MRQIVRIGAWLVALALFFPALSSAQDRVLFVTINGGYNGDGVNMFNELVNAGADATHITLSSNGQVATELAANSYDQIWVYDLSTGSDAYPSDYAAIADWWQNDSGGELICDGRFLSSFWNGRYSGEGRAVAENYFVNLRAEGGGLMLATDHNDFANLGMNAICDAIGINHFIGNFGGSFPVDQGNPLMYNPNTLANLFNDSSTSQAPFGLQPNGIVLDAVGYHSGNTQTPGISATIDGSLNMVLEITAPTPGMQLCGNETVAVTTSVSQQVDPVTYQWSSSIDGALSGTGSSIVLDAAVLTEGLHTITVLATDSSTPTALVDDADIQIQIGGEGCVIDTDGDEVFDDTDNCLDIPNADQSDWNNNGVGDACDTPPGDFNASGSYNVADALILSLHALMGTPPAYMHPSKVGEADLNCSGSVNVADVILEIHLTQHLSYDPGTGIWSGGMLAVNDADGDNVHNGCEPGGNLGSETNPGTSCMSILDAGSAQGDGAYWIDPDGAGGADAFQAYCDMTSDGGGWTLAAAVSTEDGNSWLTTGGSRGLVEGVSGETFNNAIWTSSTAPFGDFSALVAADAKSPAWSSYAASEWLVVEQVAADRGTTLLALNTTSTLADLFATATGGNFLSSATVLEPNSNGHAAFTRPGGVSQLLLNSVLTNDGCRVLAGSTSGECSSGLACRVDGHLNHASFHCSGDVTSNEGGTVSWSMPAAYSSAHTVWILLR